MNLEDFTYIENDWFRKKYADKSRGRFVTFKIALNWFLQHGGRTIVETGTTKAFDDWGAGMSTILFAEVVRRFGGRVWTIDNSQQAMEMSVAVTVEFKDHIEYILSDSVVALKTFPHRIDLLYLDSMDCPLKPEDSPLPSQNHQLWELQVVYRKLSKRAVILLDDNGFFNGGKTALSKRWLAKKGWVCLLDSQQTVWVRR